MVRNHSSSPLHKSARCSCCATRAYLFKEGARVTITSCNTLQFCTNKYGRDSFVTRLVRGERKKIDKSYELGFAALRYYADSQRSSLLLAKQDGRLWLILKVLATIRVPGLRKKIVDFAFFGKDAPERKANKAVLFSWK